MKEFVCNYDLSEAFKFPLAIFVKLLLRHLLENEIVLLCQSETSVYL